MRRAGRSPHARAGCGLIAAALVVVACASLENDPEMLKTDARWQLHQGEPLHALDTLRRAVLLAPDDVEAQVLLAQVALRVKRPGEAERALRRAIQLDPGDPSPRVARGIALTRLGRYRAAEEALLDALLLDPGNPSAVASLAEVYRLAGRPEACVERYAQLVERVAEEPEPSAVLRRSLKQAHDRERHCRRR